jgi:hypothetical protein
MRQYVTCCLRVRESLETVLATSPLPRPSDLCALLAEIRAGRHPCSPLGRSSRPASGPHTTPSNCSKQVALQGDTPIPAFKVQCDSQTTTQIEFDNGSSISSSALRH